MSELLDEYQENKILTEGDDGRLELLAAWTSIIMHQIIDIPDHMEVTRELIEPWGLTLVHALQISGFDPEDIKPIADKIMQYLKEDYNELIASNILDQLDDEPEPFDNVTEILKVLDQFATAPDID